MIRNTFRLASLALSLATAPLAWAEYTPPEGGFAQNQALYQHLVDNHLDVILQLLPQAKGDPEHALFTTHALLSYGLYNEAEKRFLGLIQDGVLSRKERGDLYMRLARYAYERGYDEAATATLVAMQEDLGNYQAYDREMLAAQVDGRRGALDESINRLAARRVAGRSNFAKYNLAMALFAAERPREARAKLDEIGRELVNDPLEHALRDRANLTLAYDYLREANGTAALPVLQRIRLDGPFSSPALLALGWAELSAVAPDRIRLQQRETSDTIGGVLGTVLRPGRVDESLRRRLGLLQSKERGGEGDLRFRRALRAWQSLADRDARKAAVLEVEVALPWALVQLGEREAARKYYRFGLERLQQAATRIDAAIDAVRTGRMFETLIRANAYQYSGWDWRATELADADETWYLSDTLASTLFQEALKNYRDLRQLQRRLRNEITNLTGDRQTGLAPMNANALVKKERRKYREPLWPDLKPELGLATELNRFPRNETLEGLLNWTYRFNPDRDLILSRGMRQAPSAIPVQFAPLKAETETLLADIEAAIPVQRILLEEIALADLNEQRDAIRRYQIDARFALARLFDVNADEEFGGQQ